MTAHIQTLPAIVQTTQQCQQDIDKTKQNLNAYIQSHTDSVGRISRLVQQLTEEYQNHIRTFADVTFAVNTNNAQMDKYTAASQELLKTLQSIYQLQPSINRATTQIPNLIESHLQGLSEQCQEVHRLLHLIFKSIQLVAPPEKMPTSTRSKHSCQTSDRTPYQQDAMNYTDKSIK